MITVQKGFRVFIPDLYHDKCPYREPSLGRYFYRLSFQKLLAGAKFPLATKGFAFGNLANCRSALLGNLRPLRYSLPLNFACAPFRYRERNGNIRL
jgi:hypothetical protein